MRHSAPASVKTSSRPSASACEPHPRRAGHDQHPHAVGDLAAAQHVGGGAQVLDAGRWCTSRGRPRRRRCRAAACRRSGPCTPARARRPRALALGRRTSPGRAPTPSSGAPWPGLVPQVTNGVSALASRTTSCVERRRRRRCAASRQYVDGGVPVGALRRVRAALQVGEGGLVRRDHAGLGAPLDGHVADRHPALHRERRGSPRRGTRRRSPGRRRCRSAAMSARIRSLAVTPGGQLARRR